MHGSVRSVDLRCASEVCAGQSAIASKRNHDFSISLISQSGKLVAEKSEYCVLFSRTEGSESTQVEDVFVEFAQQVGKIRKSPQKFPLALDNVGQYCGEADLGRYTCLLKCLGNR